MVTPGECLLCHAANFVCCVAQESIPDSVCRQCELYDTADSILLATDATMSAVSHSKQCLLCCTTDRNCCVTQQMYPWCQTAGTVCCATQQRTSAVPHSRQCLSAVRHGRQCQPCGTADIVCCVAQPTMSAVSHSMHACCVTQQTCLLHLMADMSAVDTADLSAV